MPHLIGEMRTPVIGTRFLLHGLSLSGAVLKALRNRGIHCQPGVSLEHQHRAGRYVLRGVESGGAVSDMGRACVFVSLQGTSLPWLQKIDSFAVNGRHAIFLAENLVRVDMLRVGRTCDVVITAHTLSNSSGRQRPAIQSTVLFRGRDGVLPAELWRPEHRAMRGEVVPVFYNRAGEVSGPPEAFEDAMKRASACVCCIGCRHSHAGISPVQGAK
jgi:hypothetical protein